MVENLYFIRHGSRTSISEETPLSEIGVWEADLTARYLSAIGNISSIYASPLRRTQQTAEIFSQALKLPVTTDPRLTERMRFGDRIGESYSEFIDEWNKTSRDRNYLPPMGDSSYECGSRLKAVADEISNGQRVVIVSHGGAIGDFLRSVFDDNDLSLATGSDPQTKFVDIQTCSITEVTKTGVDYKLVRISDTSHLLIPIT